MDGGALLLVGWALEVLGAIEVVVGTGEALVVEFTSPKYPPDES